MERTPNATQRFYDRISGLYDLIADAGEHRARELGLELLAATPGEHVLEVGFGTGSSLVALAQAVGSAGSVFGVDLSEGMRTIASRKVASAGLTDRVTLCCGEVPPLVFDEGRFDAVFLSFTLELFPLLKIPEVLKEVRRVLKPAGRLGIVSMATVLPGDAESALERTYKWMHYHFPHIVDCEPIEVERHLEEAGFYLDQCKRIALFTMPVVVAVGRTSSADQE